MFFLRVHSVGTNHPVSLEDAEFTTISAAKSAAAQSSPRFSERRGIAHLFRRRRGSSSLLPSHGAAESSLLFVVAVPSYLSFNDFIRFFESRLDHVAELVFIRLRCATVPYIVSGFSGLHRFSANSRDASR